MPTYDYKCLDCESSFEIFQSITEKPVAKCEKCGGRLKRLIGKGGGIIFKGSGFYVTDYKKSSSGISSGAKPAKPAGSSDEKTTAPAKTESTASASSTTSASSSESK